MPPGTLPTVLLIAFHFPPESLPGAVRPSRFFEYLPEFGYQPEVITGAVQTEAHPYIHTVPATTYIPRKYTMAGAVEILLHKTMAPTELAILWAGPASARAHRLMKDRRVSAVISTAPPLNTHLTALLLKLRYGIPWIADFRDPLFDNPFHVNWNRITTAAHRRLEKQIFRHADVILGASDVPVGWWRERYPQHAHKMHVLWNGYNPAEKLAGLPIPPRPYRVLAHIGNLYAKRSPGIIIDALERLFAKNELHCENIHLDFVGEIAHDVREAIGPSLARIEQDGIMECTGLIPRSQALRRMAESDYLLLLDIQDGEGYTVPSKLYEYIRVGRPILTVTQPGSPVQRIVAGSGIAHVFVYPDDPIDTVCGKLEEFFKLPSDSVTPSDWFLETFDGRRQTRTLASILASIEPGGAQRHAAVDCWSTDQ